MIGVIDYGMGNLGSVINALHYLEQDARLISRSENIQDCHALILPGVGAFGDCMDHLHEQQFSLGIHEWISAGKPLMGICLGLQVLFESSEESPGVKGLSIFKGSVKKFSSTSYKVPQIGWNKLYIQQENCPMFKAIQDQSYYYLVHSYYVDTPDVSLIAGETNYGKKYCSCIWRDNVFATQFHPEKSQLVGIQMLRNFCDWSLVI